MRKRKHSKPDLRKTFQGKNILVTGGCGSIGSEIVNQLLRYKPKSVRIFDHNEAAHFHMREKIPSKITRHLIGDIRDRNRVKMALRKIDIVFHAAALKHVPLCEYNPFEAVSTNVLGTQNLVDLARTEGVQKFLSISTDKAVNPINTMGATKLLSEKLTMAAYDTIRTKFSCVRFGNVLNSNGSVIPIFKRQIENGGPITITSENMTRFFMSMPEAVNLVLKSVSLMKGGEIFILKMKSLNISDLAEVMIKELAPKYNLKPSNLKITNIGIRPGEKLSECLITKEETHYIDELDDMFVLRLPIFNVHLDNKLYSKIPPEEYDSENLVQLTHDEILKTLQKYDIL